MLILSVLNYELTVANTFYIWGQKQEFHPSIRLSVFLSVCQWVGRSINQPINRLMNQSTSFPVVHQLLCFIILSTSSSHFRSWFSYSSWWRSHYLLWPSLILQAYYLSIPFQCIVFHSFQNCLCYSIFLWLLHFSLFVVWRSLELFSRNPFLYFTVYALTCSPPSKFPNRNLKSLPPLHKICISPYLQ